MWAAGFTALILLSLLFVPLDGSTHADWLQFLGRFHPLLVHLPIGLILLLPVLEILGIRRPALRNAAGLILQLALATCLIAIFFGILLAYGSGESGATVTNHLRGGVLLAIELLVCVAVRRTWLQTHHWGVYFPLLAVVLLTLTWTAHQGGSLTYGSGYLTRYMPPTLKRYVAPSAVSSHPNSFFAKHIYPVLDTKCGSCHGT